MSDITLLACASDGTVEQWDGVAPVKGVMLRWLYDIASLGFPEFGFEVARAELPDYFGVDWSAMSAAAGQLKYAGNRFMLSSRQGIEFSVQQGRTTLVVAAGDQLTFAFPGGAWALDLTLMGAGQITVTASSQGAIVETVEVRGGDSIALRTRGFDTLTITGQGFIDQFRYQLLTGSFTWTDQVRIPVPVTNANYPCRATATDSDEAQAQRRLPPGVDWAGRYQPSFGQLHAVLESMVAGTPMPAYQSPGTGDPALGIDQVELLSLALLDPHVARIVGVAYDYTDQTTSTAHAYRVTGSWRGVTHQLAEPAGLAGLTAIATVGSGNQPRSGRGGSWSVDLAHGDLELLFAARQAQMTLLATATGRATWEMHDDQGAVLAHGPIEPRAGLPLTALGIGTTKLVFKGTGTVVVQQLAMVDMVERIDIVPGIGLPTPPEHCVAPPGPPAIVAVQQSFLAEAGGEGSDGQPVDTAPPGFASVDLSWDASTRHGQPFDEAASLTFQLATRGLPGDPGGTQLSPPLRADIVDPLSQLVISADHPAAQPEWTSVAAAGWHAYWVRGLDIFGQASAFTAPAVVEVGDDRPPAPPDGVRASWIASGQPGPASVPFELAVMATNWQASGNADAEALGISWTWTQPLAVSCPAVDEFRFYMRTPMAATDGETSYDGVDWGSQIASLSVPDPAPAGVVTHGAAPLETRLGRVEQIDGTTARVVSDFTFDAGGGALAGARLVTSSGSWPILDNGVGADAWLLVDISATPASALRGSAKIEGAPSVFRLTTAMSVSSLGQGVQRFGGTMSDGTTTWIVLHHDGGTFTCAWPGAGRSLRGAPRPPASGAAVTWAPSYAIVVADTGFGDGVRAAANPVGSAQVGVTAVCSDRRESAKSLPALISYVDVDPPPVPVMAPITAGSCCAQLATPADWYGRSYFTLSWSGVSGVGYLVQRALSSALARLDFGNRWLGFDPEGNALFAVPDPAWPSDWPAPVSASTLAADFGALPAALAAALAGTSGLAAVYAQLPTAPAARANAALAALPSRVQGKVLAAYDALHADAVQLLASGAAAAAAFASLTPAPLDGATAMSYTDELPGRSSARWVYRVAARSAAGVTTTGAPTPPICAPDVVPPAAPVLLSALAVGTSAGVKLSWPLGAEPDLLRYRLYRSADKVAAGDVMDMAEVAVISLPGAAPGAGEQAPAFDASSGIVSFADPVGEGAWWYRLVAEDTSGNLSIASAPAQGRSVTPPPQPPVWMAGSPAWNASDGVSLAWQLAAPRLSVAIERRQGGGFWQPLADWLPRGTTDFADALADPSKPSDYRLKARDFANHESSYCDLGHVDPRQP